MKCSISILSFIIGMMVISGCSEHSVIYGNGEVIPIDFDKFEQLSMSDVVSKIEVIELEGNDSCYLVNPMTIQMYDGNIYMRDQHAVYVFDEEGRFIFNTSKRRGRGRNEYFSVNDYNVIDGNVGIMNHDGRIFVYDSLLNARKVYDVPRNRVLYYMDYALLNDDIMALSVQSGDSVIWNFYSTTKDKIVGSCYLSKEKKGGYRFGTSRRYISNDSLVLYRSPDNGYSYFALNPQDYTVSERFRYDVGERAFSPKAVKKDESITSYLERHPREFVIVMETLINNRFILSRVGYIEPWDGPDDGTLRLSFYDLKKGTQRLINDRFNNGKMIIGLDYMDDTCIASFINDYSYIDLLYEDSLLDDKSRQILKGVNDGTNGLIIKYYFKEDIL